MTDSIESVVQQLIAKVEATQSIIDNLESQVRQLQSRETQLQIAVDEKDAELQRLMAEKDVLFTEMTTMKDSEVKAASAERESALLHLRQVQEELEYYFLLNQEKSKMLESFEALNQRMSVLVSSLSAKH